MTNAFLLPPEDFRREFRPPHQVLRAGALTATAPGELSPGDPDLSTYLIARLKQIGVSHVMAIPGDYISSWVEELDSPVANPAPSLVRVHPNNEMCATYAADGLGRATGGDAVGCVAFTYGVGALNAVQAIAGATVEYVPVVMINGTPSIAQFNSQRDQGVLWHHMFDGTFTDLRVLSEVTAMAVRLDNPAYAADLIDAALTACVTRSRPVYIEIANTLEAAAIPGGAARLARPLRPSPVANDANALDTAVDAVLTSLRAADRLVVLGGVEIARYGGQSRVGDTGQGTLQEKFAQLVTLLQAPYLSTLLGKGILSEYTAPNFSGTYNGRNSQANVQDLVRQATHILALGVHETDFNMTGLAQTNPTLPLIGLPIEFTIEARLGAVRINSGVSPDGIGEMYWGNVSLETFVDALIARLTQESLPNAPFPGIQGEVWNIPASTAFPAGDQVTWDSFKSILQHEYLDSFTEADVPVVLADTGLSFYALNNIKVPKDGYIAQLAWGAIGYSPAASYGVKLALDTADPSGRSPRRVISVSGDGAFSQSLNALGTIAALGLDNVIFVMANGVFAIEQFLINAGAFLPGPGVDFAPLCKVDQTDLWDWRALAAGLGGVGFDVTTNDELSEVFRQLQAGSPPPTPAHGPCAQGTGAGCCDFGPSLVPTTRRSTFTLVAVHNVCDNIPSNTRWKLESSTTPPNAG